MSSPEDIDGSIMAAYKPYKIATNYFLDLTFNSGAEILLAVKALQKAKTVVPPSVIASLQHAIVKRRVALAIYQSRSTDDIQHDIFLQRLETSLEILQPMVGASDPLEPDIDPETTFITPNSYSSSSKPWENNKPGVPLAEAPILEDSKQAESLPVTSTVKGRNAFLEDDEITAICEGADFISELQVLHDELQQCWKDAANGKLPIPVAAWLTSNVFRMIDLTMPLNLDDTIGKLVESTFRGKLYGEGQTSNLELPILEHAAALFYHRLSMNKIIVEGIEFERGQLFDQVFESLNLGTGGKNSNRAEDPKSRPKLPPQKKWSIECVSKYVIRDVLRQVKKDMNGTRAITAIEQTMSYMEPRNGSCEPFYHAACELLQGGVSVVPCTLTVGVELLLSTSEAFFWPGNGDLNKTNCRLQALRLAQQMKTSLEPIIDMFRDLPIDPNGPVQWLEGARHFYNGIDTYIREKRFDLYHTMPWIAGGHMTEMLYQAQFCGNILFLHDSVVPGTLHLYNALVQSPIAPPRIPIMDELCEMFIESIFLGELPRFNFLSHFRQAVHGSKMAKSYKPQSGGTHTSRLWSNPDQRSDFMDSQRHDYRPTIAFMGHLHGVPVPAGKPQPELRDGLEALYHSTPYAEHVKKAKAAVLKDFEGPRPVMAVDYFSIYTLCAKIMSELVALMKDGSKDVVDSHEECDMPASCFLVDHLLESLVALSADKTIRISMGKNGDLTLPARAFKVVDRDLSLDQMKWKM